MAARRHPSAISGADGHHYNEQACDGEVGKTEKWSGVGVRERENWRRDGGDR